ncbi:unnamed protein product [Lota lota]
MAEATRGWQPCKENIYPSQVKIQALTLNEEPPIFPDVCDALQAGIQQQRQLFESQLLVSSECEALDVWDRYVKWSLQVSPDGQMHGELQPLLERAVMQFANKSKLHQDPRYISLWIKLAQNSLVPADMFRYMQGRELGRSHAAFYVAWAQHLESQGEFQQAERVLQEGLSYKAQPLASIQQYLCSVQVRVSGEGGTGEASSPPRRSQVDLRPRGRKRLAKSAGCSVGFNLQLPSMVPQGQSLPLQGPGALAPEGPHTSRTLSGDLQEELEAVQLPSCEGGAASEEGNAGNNVKVRSMYCKERVTQGIEEICIEELRAQRQEIDEKIRRMDDLQKKLEQELQEKQKMLLLRKSQPAALNQVDEARNLPAAEPFHIFTDPSSGSDSSSAMPYGDVRPSPNPLFNDVFLHPGEKGLCLKIQFPCPSGAVASENSHAVEGAGARHLSLTEAVVGTVQNKTLCSSPDNTRDFAGSAHLVSTPCIRRVPVPAHGLVPKWPCDQDNQGVVSQEQDAAPCSPEPKFTTGKQLSPIKETSLEAHTTHSTLGNASTEDTVTPQTGEAPLLRDPCSGETRKRLLDQAEVSCFPGYHTVGTPFPHVDQDTQLSLGSEVVFLHSKVQEEERFSVFSGFSQGNHVVLKVERSSLPWDFYVVSQLRRRLSPENSAPLPQGRCFLFLDACVTLYTLPQYQRLSKWVGLRQEGSMASVVSSLLLMMRTFHSSSLLLGALDTDSLLLTHGDFLLSLDLLTSLDLELQTDVTSASQVPAALGYIQQGVLKTTDSPYQVDLLCLAEAVHLLLTKRRMIVVEEEDGWMVEKLGRNAARFGRKSAWRKMFHLLLNSSGHSSVSVLSQLLDLVAMTPSW